MKRRCSALVWCVLVFGLPGCTGTDRQPECRGPWTPVNVSQDPRHG